MIRQETTITNPTGLHARPAAGFVALAKKLESAVTIRLQEQNINAKNILALMTAGLSCGTKIELVTEGKDEADAMDSLLTYLKGDLG